MNRQKIALIFVVILCVAPIIISLYKMGRLLFTSNFSEDVLSQPQSIHTQSGDVTTLEKVQTFFAGQKNVTLFSDEEFSSWINTESKQLESRISDEKFVQAEVRAQAARLTESQLKDLKSIIENSQEPIHKRIFSNYVMINSFNPLSDQILSELIQQSTEEFKSPQETHSAEEVKRSQEYALKFMQIDEMVQRLQNKDEDPLTFLIDLSKKSNDSQIKSYASQKIRNITGQK